MTKDAMFVSVVIFWIFVIIFTSFMNVTINQPEYYNTEGYKEESSTSFNMLNIFKIMFFSVDSSIIPYWISVFLDIFAIFTVYIIVISLKPIGQ